MTNFVTQFIQDVVTSGADTFLKELLADLYYMVFMIENNITQSSGTLSINFNAIYSFIYAWASIILTLLFIKKMISCYMVWSSGDPDTSPLVIVLNYIKALIVMIIFGQIYKLVISVGYTFYSGTISQITTSTNSAAIISATVQTSGIAWAIAILILMCCWIALIFQMMMRGIEVLVLRLIMPFGAIGLLNSDGGSFNVFIKKFMQNIATVIIQIALVKLSVEIAVLNHIIYAIGTAMVALRTPAFLQEFMLVRSGTPISQRVRGFASGAVAAWKGIK